MSIAYFFQQAETTELDGFVTRIYPVLTGSWLVIMRHRKRTSVLYAESGT